MTRAAHGRVLAALLLASAAVAGAGCGDRGRENLPDPFAVAPVCSSGTMLPANYQPSPEMAPGRACITCHVQENTASGEEGDAPVFSFAGTAYPTGHEPDDCSGAAAAGAVVELTDARGMTFQATVNDGGNFYDEIPGFTFPYTARIEFNGQTRVMLEPQRRGDCNACHTQDGTDTDDPTDPAPGRILLP